MATILQPFAPWMRDLSRFMNTPGAASPFLPPADVLVSEDGVTVYMDVAGIKAEDLDIQLENDMLTVRGERRPPWGSLDGCTARIERSFGAFERTLRVTDGLDPDAIEASISDGVLMMRLPQPAQTQPRRIQIRPGTTAGNGASMPAPAEGGRADSAPAAGEPQGGAGESAPAAGNVPEGAPAEAPSPAAPSEATV
jgi:HSP20 family protein